MSGQLPREMLVELPPELELRVERAAEEKGIGPSEFVRDALMDALAAQGSERAIEWQSQQRGKRA